jgi:prevent-host-death family protein
MEVSISEAKGKLTDLARRAERGETVLFTRHGRPFVKLVAVDAPRRERSSEERRAALDAIAARGAALREKYGFTGKQLQDDLYDENGWPV